MVISSLIKMNGCAPQTHSLRRVFKLLNVLLDSTEILLPDKSLIAKEQVHRMKFCSKVILKVMNKWISVSSL